MAVLKTPPSAFGVQCEFHRFAVGERGLLLATTNAGQSWTQIPTNSQATLRAILYSAPSRLIGHRLKVAEFEPDGVIVTEYGSGPAATTPSTRPEAASTCHSVPASGVVLMTGFYIA